MSHQEKLLKKLAKKATILDRRTYLTHFMVKSSFSEVDIIALGQPLMVLIQIEFSMFCSFQAFLVESGGSDSGQDYT